jgi:hypothetical protein
MFHPNQVESGKDDSSSEALFQSLKTSGGSYLDKELGYKIKLY